MNIRICDLCHACVYSDECERRGDDIVCQMCLDEEEIDTIDDKETPKK
jgi:formylmethanofuran dehydrogenase subunit E